MTSVSKSKSSKRKSTAYMVNPTPLKIRNLSTKEKKPKRSKPTTSSEEKKSEEIVYNFSTMNHTTGVMIEDCFGGLEDMIDRISMLDNIKSLYLIHTGDLPQTVFSNPNSTFNKHTQIETLLLSNVHLTVESISQLKKFSNLRMFHLINIKLIDATPDMLFDIASSLNLNKHIDDSTTESCRNTDFNSKFEI